MHPASDGVPAGRERILDPTGEANPLTLRDGVLARPMETRAHAEDQRAVRVGHVNHEPGGNQLAARLQEHIEHDRLALGNVLHRFARIIEQPRVNHLGVEVRHRIERRIGWATVGEVQPEVPKRRLFGIADVLHLSRVEDHGAVAHRLYGRHVMRHEHDRGSRSPLLLEDVHAALGKGSIADGKDLVDEHDVGLGLHHDREGEPHHHSRRVVLELQLREVPELREVQDGVEAPARLTLGQAHQHAVDDAVLTRAQLRIEAHAELDKGRQATGHSDRARVRCIDAREDLEQGALSRSVLPDDAEELAGANVERDVAQGTELAILDAGERMRHALLEGVHSVLGDAERLLDSARLDHNWSASRSRPAQRSRGMLLFDGDSALHAAPAG